MTDDKILKALRFLAEEDRCLEAPPALAWRILAEFRVRRRRRFLGKAAAWTLATAAAVMSVLLLSHGPAKEPSPVAGAPQRVMPQALSQAATPTPAPVQIAPRSRGKSGASTARTFSASLPAVPESRPEIYTPQVVTDFYPLLDPAPPFERGQLLRVNLPASAMRSIGLPVHEDRLNEAVQADILLGEEGLPRAIRFVGFQVR